MFVERSERIGHNFRIRIAQFRGEDAAAVQPQRG
jgi:hemoglobin